MLIFNYRDLDTTPTQLLAYKTLRHPKRQLHYFHGTCKRYRYMDQGSRITFIIPKMAHGVSLPQSLGRLPKWVREPAFTNCQPILSSSCDRPLFPFVPQLSSKDWVWPVGFWQPTCPMHQWKWSNSLHPSHVSSGTHILQTSAFLHFS